MPRFAGQRMFLCISLLRKIPRVTCKPIPVRLGVRNDVEVLFSSFSGVSCQIHHNNVVWVMSWFLPFIYRFWRYCAAFSLLVGTGKRAFSIVLYFSPTTHGFCITVTWKRLTEYTTCFFKPKSHSSFCRSLEMGSLPTLQVLSLLG